MTLLFFKFGLPALLGFTLFVGIAGRLNPFSKPYYPEERPSWLFGIWTGLSVAFVLSVGLHVAYGMTLEGARSLARPSASLMATLLIPGFMIYLWHKRQVRQELAYSAKPSFDWSKQENNIELHAEIDALLASNSSEDRRDDALEFGALDISKVSEENEPVIAAFFDSADLHTVDIKNLPEPVNDSGEPMVGSVVDMQSATEVEVEVDAETDTDTDTSIIACNDDSDPSDDMSLTQFIDLKAMGLSSTADETDIALEQLAASSTHVDDDTTTTAELVVESKPESVVESETARESESETVAVFNSEAAEGFESETISVFEELATTQFADIPDAEYFPATNGQQALANEIQQDSVELEALQKAFEEENQLRTETEKHLRITRKAFAKIESQTRDYESRKADSIIALEDQLAQSITLQSDFEYKAATERTRRIDLENNIVQLKQDVVRAKHDVRHSIAARAKALSTANKSIAFARQAIQIRGRLESKLADAKKTIDNRQATISSLIGALEKEKSRTDEDVATLAKQYVLREKQLRTRKNLEFVSRSIESELTTRLVKKVAKARPVLREVASTKR